MQWGGVRKKGNYLHISHSILDFLEKEKNNNFLAQKIELPLVNGKKHQSSGRNLEVSV